MAIPRAVSSRADVAVVASLCGLGAAIRIPGLTSRDLWFDDSWAALPAHVPLHDALRMVVTTPLYTLAMRLWIGVLPQDTWWAQLPALVLGVAAIAAVWALVRSHGFSRLTAAATALLVAVGPVTVAYSTRVKEYGADLLLACLVLWLVERWRRAPQGRQLVVLGLVSIASLWISASTAAVIGGAAATTIFVAWSRPSTRRQVAAYLGALVLGAGSVWLVFLRHLPGQLRANWRTHGFLFGYSSARHVEFAFQQTFAGIAHGLLGIPIPYTFQGYALRAWPIALAVVTVVVLGSLVALPLAQAIRTKGEGASAVTASAAAIAIAVVGTLAGLVPLGDGRTDEVLYPAILLLGAAATTRVATHVPVPARVRRSGHIALAGSIAVVAVWFGLTHLGEYPPTGLRTAYAELQPLLRPGDLVVVDGYEQFTWADEGLTPWQVSFQQGDVPWPMGFHVVSAHPGVNLSPEYLQPDPMLPALVAKSSRVWLVGPTVGGFSISDPRALWGLPANTPTVRELECPVSEIGLGARTKSFLKALGCTAAKGGLGLHPTKTFFEYSGTYVWLYVHPPHRR